MVQDESGKQIQRTIVKSEFCKNVAILRIGSCYRKLKEYLKRALEIWNNANPEFIPAQKARAKLKELQVK